MEVVVGTAAVLRADAGVPFGAGAPQSAPTVPPGAPSIADVLVLLRSVPLAADGAGLIDQMRGLEDLKCLAGARQADTAVAFDLSQRREQAAAGVPADEQGAAVWAQIALARRESPARGSRLLGMAKTLKGMPHTFRAFRSGLLNEWRVTLIVKETICLTPEDRAGVDEELAADAGTLDGAGDRAIIAAVRAAAYRRDPASVAQRAARAVAERTVSLRPAPDTMAYLTALLPVAQGVAAYAALTRDADSLRTSGDERSRGQVMADSLVERVTGTPGGISGVQIQLVMTDRTFLQADAEPARLPGYGITPAAWARNTALSNPAASGIDGVAGQRDLEVWVRRLYTAPATGELVAMDSKARLVPAGLKRFLQIRDDTCRTPYCDAPIRHHDHIIPWHDDGSTSTGNGQGLCETCNHTKETPGWTAKPVPGPRHTVATTTPTGHTYHSTAPPLPSSGLAGTRSRRSQQRCFALARATP
ncbi:HNH endonuclease [Pseudarthrobacter sp. BRE9]|uniref:HNH endonuclease n=1 Tax=Pseudarthrobacter sp. BRE9 TaxID=2962582 RepID=UPI002881C7C9|nr:HNH endonuclease [Pseudarthrobacter sp. BRE9]MDT0171288.1 HNH endonuclease [Pseudarthrobacter sp. BRE9]